MSDDYHAQIEEDLSMDNLQLDDDSAEESNVDISYVTALEEERVMKNNLAKRASWFKHLNQQKKNPSRHDQKGDRTDSDEKQSMRFEHRKK